MKAPEKVPEQGFYYHYKHDELGTINNYAYEFLGAGCHTEEECRAEDMNMAVYRPMYVEAFVYKAGRLFYLRPLAMWMGEVSLDGKALPRFKKITDPSVIEELELIKDKLYPPQNK